MPLARLRQRRHLLLGAGALLLIAAFGLLRAATGATTTAGTTASMDAVHGTHLHDDGPAAPYAVEFHDAPDAVAAGQLVPVRFSVSEHHEHLHGEDEDDGHVHSTIHVDVVVIDPEGTETHLEPSTDLNDHRVEVPTAAAAEGAHRVVVRTTDGDDIGELVLDAR